MQQSELVIGRGYAYRASGRRDDLDFVKVKVLGPFRGARGRIQYQEGGLAGLAEWVRTVQIVCRWGDRKAFIRDTQQAQRLAAADARVWDNVIAEAIDSVITASGEFNGFLRRWDTDPAPAMRLWSRGHLEGSPLEFDPMNFADRSGVWHLSFTTAEKASQAFAAAEPDLVELYLRRWEDRLKAQGFQPGIRHAHDVLRQWAPQIALARSWTQSQAVKTLDDEVQRLQRVVNEAIGLLRRAGDERGAARIERALGGG